MVSEQRGSEVVSIAHGDYELEVLPALGASIAGLRFAGLPVLRRTAPGLTEPLESAGFALVPFANRIAEGRFRFGASEVRLDRNAPGQAHPLHGQAWRAPWRIESVSTERLALAFEHSPGQWPWRYTARQVFTLGPRGLEVTLSVHNQSEQPMPAGLGWHPYFHRSRRMRLRAAVGPVWLIDAECLPTRLAPASYFGDWASGQSLPTDRLIDHCYSEWQGLAELEWPEQSLRLRLTAGAPLQWLHVYVPPGESFVCLEPVSHMPDALNRTEPAQVTGAQTLAPGATLEASVGLRVLRGSWGE